jgi:hypothetical protein
MPRIYKTKGDDAKTAKVTIPITTNLLQRLRSFAAEAGLTPTVAARAMIEAGVAEDDLKKRKVE